MRGGKRSGAGRRKGAPNKATAARQATISASGEAPLDYMIRIMRDESAPVERRDEMAKAAAPYVHPKLAAIEYAGTLSDKPPSQMTDEELTAVIREGQAQLAAMCNMKPNDLALLIGVDPDEPVDSGGPQSTIWVTGKR